MTGDHFPNHGGAHDALLAFGLDANRSYERWMLELAPARISEILALGSGPDGCEVCGRPLPAQSVGRPRVTCSAACRTRLWRLSREG